MTFLRPALVAAATTLAFALPVVAVAQPAGDTAEAGQRFSAGVALYNEADYAAALVEFKRAYAIAPNFVVLYNIGQTHFQLQDYAAAYTVLTQFLREAPGGAAHHAEVTATVEQLKGRVGKIDVSTTEPGAEVTIDEVVVGKTPLPAPVLVSIGRRKVTVTAPGMQPQTRTIDVAAGDTIRQEVALVAPVSVRALAGPKPERSSREKLIAPAWITTGVLAAGAITFGALAWRASSSLDDLRATYPVTVEALEDQADKLKLYSTLADGLVIATVAVGVTALALTFAGRKGDSKERTSVGIGPRGVMIGGSF